MKTIPKIILLFVFLISAKQVDAQVDTMSLKKNHKIILSISSGVSIPVGKFSKFDLYDKRPSIAGIPNIGGSGKIEVKYFLTEKIGVSSMIYTSVNKAEAIDSTELFYTPCPNCIPSGKGSIIYRYKYETKSWYTSGILAGVVAVINKKNPIFIFKVNGGIQRVQSPGSRLGEVGYDFQIPWDSSYIYTAILNQPELISYNFIFNTGLDLHLNIKNKLGLVFSINYLTSRASFKGQSNYEYVEYKQHKNYKEEIKDVSFTKNISLLNFNVGINYLFK